MKMILRETKATILLLLMLLPLGAVADNRAPDFTLPTQNGETITLSDLKGRVIYLDFWASWCAPCRQSFPWLNRLHQKSDPKQFKIIAINVDNDERLAKQFLTKLPADFTIAFDPKGDVAEAYQLPAMPTSFLIDQSGHVVSRHIGFLQQDREQLALQIQQLIERER
ncbi:MAG: TlpA family protein disulfide reductase [Candidatus Polarisedimenticolaceae bacterium]|nr:TlpA family protein disulfide reductase [Candidatus Polarisedimenticolaceae bacterium]